MVCGIPEGLLKLVDSGPSRDDGTTLFGQSGQVRTERTTRSLTFFVYVQEKEPPSGISTTVNGIVIYNEKTLT